MGCGGALTLILGLGGTDTHMGGAPTPHCRLWGGHRHPYWRSLTLILGWGAQTPIWGGHRPHITGCGGALTLILGLGGHRPLIAGCGGALTLILGWGAQTLILEVTDPHIGVGGRRPSYWRSLTLILGWGAQTLTLSPGV